MCCNTEMRGEAVFAELEVGIPPWPEVIQSILLQAVFHSGSLSN